jgi:hypothetical protein
MSRKLTKRHCKTEERRIEELCEREARRKRHEPAADGYTLVRANERCHPAHSAELVERIDALARYLGMGSYEPTSSRKGCRKRAHRLWKRAYGNYEAMLREPDWRRR